MFTKWPIIRTARGPIQASDRPPGKVAQAETEREAIATQAALRTLVPFLALLPVFGGLIWLGVGRGLGPLESMSRAVAKRRADEMAPIADRGSLSARPGMADKMAQLRRDHPKPFKPSLASYAVFGTLIVAVVLSGFMVAG